MGVHGSRLTPVQLYLKRLVATVPPKAMELSLELVIQKEISNKI